MGIVEIISDVLIGTYIKQRDKKNLKLIKKLKQITDVLHKYRNYANVVDYTPIDCSVITPSFEFSDRIRIYNPLLSHTVYYEYSEPQNISQSAQEDILNIDMSIIESRLKDAVKKTLASHIMEGNRKEVIKDINFCLQNFIF